jgi:hypothetical protein
MSQSLNERLEIKQQQTLPLTDEGDRFKVRVMAILERKLMKN